MAEKERLKNNRLAENRARLVEMVVEGMNKMVGWSVEYKRSRLQKQNGERSWLLFDVDISKRLLLNGSKKLFVAA